MKRFQPALRSLAMIVILALASLKPAFAAGPAPEKVMADWYRLVLELVRHTSNYSPPVASRSFAYLGIVAYEVGADEAAGLPSLQGQLNGLTAGPAREAGKTYDLAVALNAALGQSTLSLFDRTGPTGQRALAALAKKMRAKVADGVPADVLERSERHGLAVAAHILAWSQKDGGAVVENMGFPRQFALGKGPAHWVPTSKIALQQVPLLPDWGNNRTFAMPNGASCGLPAPPDYSEDKASAFYKEALEVHETAAHLNDEQRLIARFWSDDPMLSTTPPGHWISIAMQILKDRKAGYEESARVQARLGIALADAFIGCWNAKFQYDLVRPVTYIRKTMDKAWEPLLITPPFPEYPSGHSTQSGAAAAVLAGHFGENFAFVDRTYEDDGMPGRSFANFSAAAREAAMSRLYGGIHFRSAIERGLDQGQCIGAFANALNMGK